MCGAVTFEVTGDLPGADACHCIACRKHSGHYFVSTDVPRTAVIIHGAENVTWYQSSGRANRGFCSFCGASMFWDPIAADWIGIAMGAFDAATDARIAMHIFVAEKGDYYEISDGVQQFEHTPNSG